MRKKSRMAVQENLLYDERLSGVRVDGTSRPLPVAAASVSDQLPRSEAGLLKERNVLYLCSLLFLRLLPYVSLHRTLSFQV